MNSQKSIVRVRIPGVEFMEALVGIAQKQGASIGLIGGRSGLAVRALERLRRKYPGLRGWAIEPEQLSVEQIAQKIRKTNIRMVFVGLGAPKQEYFIEKLAYSIEHIAYSKTKTLKAISYTLSASPLILMSVGGSFDIISGSLKRAPVLLRSIGFEWLWRLFKEPWRWKRQLTLLKFGFLVLKEKIRTS